MTTCSTNRASSIELNHTSNRRMQITLPENTTHIVICTSGRGNNNKQNSGCIPGNNSVTLDINPDPVGPLCCNETCRLSRKGCACNSSTRGNDTIIKRNKIPIETNKTKASLSLEVNRSKSAADCGKEKIVSLGQPNDEFHVDSVASDEWCNEEGRKGQYHCAECGKCYSTSSNLARHRQTHR